MTLLRDGLKMGGAYLMMDSLMKKRDQGSPAPPPQQQPVYVQQPVQYGQQPVHYGQQPNTYSRQAAPTQPPPYNDDQALQHSSNWVGNDGYVHADYCNGSCGGRCNGSQNTRQVDRAAGSGTNNANGSQSSFQPDRKS